MLYNMLILNFFCWEVMFCSDWRRKTIHPTVYQYDIFDWHCWSLPSQRSWGHFQNTHSCGHIKLRFETASASASSNSFVSVDRVRRKLQRVLWGRKGQYRNSLIPHWYFQHCVSNTAAHKRDSSFKSWRIPL